MNSKETTNQKPVSRTSLDGSKCWYLNGKLHNTNGPAIEFADGSKYWFQFGQLHRVNGPAIEKADGTKVWYLNGKSTSFVVVK